MVDYYAMGVLVAILSRGANPAEQFQDNELLEKKFEEGAYKIITDGFEVPIRLLDLLRGVLNERQADAWGAKEVQEWIKGRRFNLLAPAHIAEAGRPIIFNSKKYTNRIHLVYGLYMNWDEARKFVREDTILRWIDRNSLEAELSKKLRDLASH